MCNSDRRHFLAMSVVALGAAAGAAGMAGAALAADTPAKKVYVCPPCGCAADGKEFAQPGACPECGNPLEGFEPYVWRGVCHVLEAAVGAEPKKIRRETRLVHDLGAGL